MGRQKKGFNAEARKSSSGTLVDQEDVARMQKKVVANDNQEHAVYGQKDSSDANVMVLPNKKRLFKADKRSQQEGKLLSKKRRKLLEHIVDQKKKKAGRAELLGKLQQVQIEPDILQKMTSLSSVQTKGIKRQMAEEEWEEEMAKSNPAFDMASESISNVLRNPMKRQKFKKLAPKPQSNREENILGFDDDSSSGSDESEDEEKVEPSKEESEESSVSEETSVGEETVKENEKTSEEKSPEKKITAPFDNDLKPKVVLCGPKASMCNVAVQRLDEVQKLREKLPINAEEQAIVEAINENPVVILAGETGSGKTTQVPQFLYEAGYTRGGKLIGVTEPRRVAAMSMSKRVGYELNDPEKVSYQIRFEGDMSKNTEIKFMTDGILLKEMAKDFRLRKYAVIIIDEAHERSVFTDILIGSLSRIVKLREKDEENGPLRFIIMSATLRVEDFTENRRLFQTIPPCIKVESRQFDTTVHFQRVTPDDYLSAALKKTCKIHRQLPDGGILVFVTGQQEVNLLVRKLRQTFPSKNKGGEFNSDNEEEEEEKGLRKLLSKKKLKKNRKNLSNQSKSEKEVKLDIALDNYRMVPLDDTEADALKDMEEDEDLEEGEGKAGGNLSDKPMYVLPLYSLLNSWKQARIFEPVPEGQRLCVVATNIAETSLTIPGIKYVIDTGKVKTKFYDKLTGVSTFQVTWISKASANQRAGRAGRQGPGHCYRIFSSEVFNNSFKEHSEPEIVKRPVDDLILQMKAMKILNVHNFPFPTPPDAEQIKVAEQKLISLGALESRKKEGGGGRVNVLTDIGKSMAAFPLAPCFSKMLALSSQHDLMPYSIALVSALSVQEVLMERPVGSHVDAFNKEEVTKIRKIWAGKGHHFLLGDPMLLLKAICLFEADPSLPLDAFCNRYSLRFKAMTEIRKLRTQLTKEVNHILPGINLDPHHVLKSPDSTQALLLRQIVMSGMVNNVARKVELDIGESGPKVRENLKCAYKCGNLEEPVFLHSSSIFVLKSSKEKLPEWIVYQDIFEDDRSKKMFIRGATAIEPEWLPTFAKSQCNFLAPCLDPEPWYDEDEGVVKCQMKGTFGPQAWPLPVIDLPFPVDESNNNAVKYFAKFFLEGKVLSVLQEFSPKLLYKPGTLTRSQSFRTGDAMRPLNKFLNKLATEKVNSQQSFADAYRKDESFLKEEYKCLLPRSLHEQIDSKWPTIMKC